MTPQKAAETLGSFLGLSGGRNKKLLLEPGAVVDIPRQAMLRVLEEASGGIRDLRDASRPVLERMVMEEERRKSSSSEGVRRDSLKLLSSLEPLNDLDRALFVHADSVTRRFFGDEVYLRGIVEFSNVCANDCGYCGIRKFQRGVKRYEDGGRESERELIRFFFRWTSFFLLSLSHLSQLSLSFC